MWYRSLKTPGGITRSLNVTYLRPLPLPATIWVKSQVVQHGRSVSLVGGTITSQGGGTVYFTCEHHKVNVKSLSRQSSL